MIGVLSVTARARGIVLTVSLRQPIRLSAKDMITYSELFKPV